MRYISARKTQNSDRESAEFLSLNNCGAFLELSRPLYTSRPEGRMDFQLIYIAAGTIELTENKKTCRIESGNVILFRPQEPQTYVVAADSEFYWIHFSGTATKDMLGFFEERVYKVGAFPEFEEFCKESVSAFAAKKINHELFCAGRLVSLVALLSQKLETDDTEIRSILNAALLDMHTSFTVQRTNEEYARMCGLSKSHFIRLFHKCTGMAPQKYLTALAMREAKHLLKSNNVSDTADILGYTDAFYFSRVFKKHIGISPSEYKKSFMLQADSTSV